MTQTASVLFLPLCGGGDGEKMERAMPLSSEPEGGRGAHPPIPAIAYRVTAAPAPPPGPMNSVSIFCLFFVFIDLKKEKLKGEGKV